MASKIVKPDFSADQLLEKIKERDQKIGRYEKRLTDVVVAFKNLQKEKAALEETLKQVNYSGAKSVARKKLRSPVSGGGSGAASETEEDAAADRNADGVSPDEVSEAYEARIGKLLESVNALTQQKNEMLASYQADKRKLREEFEQTIADLKRDVQSSGIVRRDLEGQLADLRARQRQQQKVEQDTSALQAQLAGERSAREALESQLSDCRRQLADAASLAAQLEASHRQSVSRLERSLDSRHTELAALAADREARVGELEARIADLSAGLGEAERRRQADAKAIRRLRDRLDSLERANSATASVMAAESSSAHPVAVVEPLPRLLAQLSIDSTKSDDQAALDFEQVDARLSAADQDPHAGCREQTRQLRSELELVRQRLVAATAAATASASAELQRAQRDLRVSRERCQDLEAETARREQSALARDAEAERRRREEVTVLRRELTGRAREAEEELTRHRDRTLRLLAEKDAELRAALAGQVNSSSRGGSLQPPPPAQSSPTPEAAEEFLLVDRLRPSAAACTSVHAQLEGARTQADVAGLREARRQAEMRLRGLQSELAEQRQVIAELRVELARCQQPTQESAEYVRNLVFRFLTLADDQGAKRTILSALCTVLNFSESEKHRALLKQLPASSWW